MRKLPCLLLALSALFVAPLAHADEKCEYVPRDRWVPIDTVISKAESLGYDVRSVEPDDGCWEVEGFDRNGAKIELYIHPASGEVVDLSKRSLMRWRR